MKNIIVEGHDGRVIITCLCDGFLYGEDYYGNLYIAYVMPYAFSMYKFQQTKNANPIGVILGVRNEELEWFECDTNHILDYLFCLDVGLPILERFTNYQKAIMNPCTIYVPNDLASTFDAHQKAQIIATTYGSFEKYENEIVANARHLDAMVQQSRTLQKR